MTIAYSILSAIAVALPMLFFFWAPGEFPLWSELYAITVEVLALAVLLWMIRRQYGRTLAAIRVFSPRVRQAGFDWRLGGTTIVLDRGVVLALLPGALTFTLFGSPGGGRAVPSLHGLRGLRRGMWKMRPRLGVDHRRGPMGLRSHLEELRNRLGSWRAVLSVVERPATAMPDPQASPWLAVLFIGDRRWMRRAERFVEEIDRIDALLEEAHKVALLQGSQS